MREHLRQSDKMIRLVEERAVNQRSWAEDFELRLLDKVALMREEMVRDMKGVGKELALDIVALNRKIENKTQQMGERGAQWEAVVRRCEQKLHKVMKQYN